MLCKGFLGCGGETRGKKHLCYPWLLNIFSIDQGWLLVLQRRCSCILWWSCNMDSCMSRRKQIWSFVLQDRWWFTNETILSSIDLRRIWIPDADGSTAAKSHWLHVSSLLSGWDSQFEGNEKVVGGKKHLWKQLCLYSFSVNAPFKHKKCYLYLSETVEHDTHKITKKA